jgi:hypothetical protein
VRALLASEDHVRLAIFEWSGQTSQDLVVDWTEVRSQADIDRISAMIAAHARAEDKLPTALGDAIDYGRRLLARTDACPAQTLDISGDGRNNIGDTPEQVYARADFDAILVNGLAIGGHEADIALYFRQHLIHGRGAFVEWARIHADFPRAFRRKLERELTEPLMGRLDQQGSPG